jgi:hypothetical protein
LLDNGILEEPRIVAQVIDDDKIRPSAGLLPIYHIHRAGKLT